jgi:predicted CXXCH cytochrome family protein
MFHFRPGLPTSDFFLVFERTSKLRNMAVGQVEQMKLSRCYRESNGQLGCTSCHDPHRVPARQELAAYFRRRCLTCHEQHVCSLPLSARLIRSPDDSCITCHMPALTGRDIAHVATTDHRILRNPQNQTPDQFRQFDSNAPLRLVNDDDPASSMIESPERELGIALTFEGGAYPNTPEGRELGLRALKLLEVALAERPDDLEVKRMRARALTLAGRRRAAIEQQREILKVAPSFEQVLEELVQYTIETKDYQLALTPAAEAASLNPMSSDLHERLAYLLCQVRDWNGASREAHESLRLNPFRRFARMFLTEVLLQQYDRAGAEAELARLLKLHPNERGALEEWYAEKRRSLGH